MSFRNIYNKHSLVKSWSATDRCQFEASQKIVSRAIEVRYMYAGIPSISFNELEKLAKTLCYYDFNVKEDGPNVAVFNFYPVEVMFFFMISQGIFTLPVDLPADDQLKFFAKHARNCLMAFEGYAAMVLKVFDETSHRNVLNPELVMKEQGKFFVRRFQNGKWHLWDHTTLVRRHADEVHYLYLTLFQHLIGIFYPNAEPFYGEHLVDARFYRQINFLYDDAPKEEKKSIRDDFCEIETHLWRRSHAISLERQEIDLRDFEPVLVRMKNFFDRIDSWDLGVNESSMVTKDRENGDCFLESPFYIDTKKRMRSRFGQRCDTRAADPMCAYIVGALPGNKRYRFSFGIKSSRALTTRSIHNDLKGQGRFFIKCDQCSRVFRICNIEPEVVGSMLHYNHGTAGAIILENDQESPKELRISKAWKNAREHMWDEHIDVIALSRYDNERAFCQLIRSKQTSSHKRSAVSKYQLKRV